tara:strand:+ start:537 stop:740 length:204 start_codon:yes stop_codon:yes gene_type:complete
VDSEKLVNLVLDDAPAHEISDAIKDALYAKSAAQVETERPVAVADLFGNKNDEVQPEVESEEPENED